MAVPGYDSMAQELELTGDNILSEFHVTRSAVLEYCVVFACDPVHSVSMVMFVTIGGVSSMNTPSDVAVVMVPALLMATMCTYTVMFVGRGGVTGWRSEEVEGGRGVGERREMSPGKIPADTT